MKIKKIEGISKTHPITINVMATSSKMLSQFDDLDSFIDYFGKIPKGADADEYRTTFIDQINQANTTNPINPNDSIDDQFDQALEIFHTRLRADFFGLSQALKDINLPAISMKGLYHGLLDALEDGLNEEQLNTIYEQVDEECKNKFFRQKDDRLTLKKTKSTKELIRHLRNNTDIKIKLTPDQVKNILDTMEMGDLINLDTLTSTTKSKATDFWTSMLVTTYRWSGTVVEIAALARYLPFLATLNNYLVAPIVTVIGFVVALFNYKKHQIKEANLNLKFLKRCVSKNHFKSTLEEIQSEVESIDNFSEEKAYTIIRQWITDSEYAEDFESTFEEIDDLESPVEKMDLLKTELLKQRHYFDDHPQLNLLIKKIAPAEESDHEDDVKKPAKAPENSFKIFGHELPEVLQQYLNQIVDFFAPILSAINVILSPLFSSIKKHAGPYVMPVLFGIITAAGIITLTLFYTLAPEILIPITILAVFLGAGTGVLRFLRDRQREMSHSIMQGSKIDKCALKDEINDLNHHKKICQALQEVQQETLETDQSEEQEDEQVEITLKGENNTFETFHVSKAALLGLQRNSAINGFHKATENGHPPGSSAPEIEYEEESSLTP